MTFETDFRKQTCGDNPRPEFLHRALAGGGEKPDDGGSAKPAMIEAASFVRLPQQQLIVYSKSQSQRESYRPLPPNKGLPVADWPDASCPG